MDVVRNARFDRPNARTLAFADGQTKQSPSTLVLNPDQVQLGTPLPKRATQVLIQNEDAGLLAQETTPAVKAAGVALEPGGTLLITTGRSAMFSGDKMERQLREAGFKNFGLVVRDNAFVTAEKAIAQNVDDVSPQQANLLLARTQFAGDPDAHQKIQQAGLGPRFTTTVRGRRIHMSKPFKGKGYSAYIGYVESDDGSLQARTFYQSRSQGIWRSASGLMGHSIFGKGPKGSFESSTNLPVDMQRRLSEISRNTEAVETNPRLLDELIHAPLEKLSTTEPSRFDESIDTQPFGSFQKRVALGQYQSVGEPTSFRYDNPGQEPDFSKEPQSFELDHPTRGSLQATTVDSRSGDHRYLFLQDSEKRTWLGQVESLSELNDFGVPTQALQDDSLTHPAIEYSQQLAEPYRGEVVTWDKVYNNITKQEETLPGYVDATAYTEQLPPVRAFLAQRA